MAKAKAFASDPHMVTLRDLSGGVDLRHSPTLLDPTRAQRLENFCLEEVGALKTVPGYTSWGEAFATDIQGMARIYLTAGTVTLVATNGEITVVEDDGTWSTAEQRARAATHRPQCALMSRE